MTAAAWRNVPAIRAAMFAWQGLVIISTIPIGGLYVIDLIAGAACWGLAHLLWRKAQRVNTDDQIGPRGRTLRLPSIAMPPFT